MAFLGARGSSFVDGVILYREIPLFTQHTTEEFQQIFRTVQETKVMGATHVYDQDRFRLICNKLEDKQESFFKIIPSFIVEFQQSDRLPNSYEIIAFEADKREVEDYNDSVRKKMEVLGLQILGAYDPLYGLIVSDRDVLLDSLYNPDIITLASGSIARVDHLPAFESNSIPYEELYD